MAAQTVNNKQSNPLAIKAAFNFHSRITGADLAQKSTLITAGTLLSSCECDATKPRELPAIYVFLVRRQIYVPKTSLPFQQATLSQDSTI